MLFLRALVQSEMQTALFRIWTRVDLSISNDDNSRVKCASKKVNLKRDTFYLRSLEWNDYHMAIGVQILNKSVCISYSSNILGKGINPTILRTDMSKIVRGDSVLGEGKL